MCAKQNTAAGYQKWTENVDSYHGYVQHFPTGVRFAEKTSVKRVLTDNGRVTGVETADNQIINCRYFVNAAGMVSLIIIWPASLRFVVSKNAEKLILHVLRQFLGIIR